MKNTADPMSASYNIGATLTKTRLRQTSWTDLHYTNSSGCRGLFI